MKLFSRVLMLVVEKIIERKLKNQDWNWIEDFTKSLMQKLLKNPKIPIVEKVIRGQPVAVPQNRLVTEVWNLLEGLATTLTNFNANKK